MKNRRQWIQRIAVSAMSLFCFSICSSKAQAQMEDNPEFALWSKHKAGTVVFMKTSSSAGGVKSETVMTNKLTEVTDEKLVIETTMKTTVNGMSFDVPASKRDIAKKYDKSKLAPGMPAPTGLNKPEGTTDEGEEKVKIGETEYKTKWYKTKTKVAGNEMESKVWLSEEVPGGMIKLKSMIAGTETTIEVTEIKKP